MSFDVLLLDPLVVSATMNGHSLHREDAEALRVGISELPRMLLEVEVPELPKELSPGSHGGGATRGPCHGRGSLHGYCGHEDKGTR